MTRKLKISESKKIRGVRVVVYCCKCKREYTTGICHKTKGNNCLFAETHHAFRYYLHVPENGGNKRQARILKGVKNIEEAQRIAMNHKQELRNGRVTQPPILTKSTIETIQPKEELPQLKDMLARHLDVLSNHNIAPHLHKKLSKDYINDISRGYRYLAQSLQESGYDLNSFAVVSIDDTAVGKIHNFFLNKDGLNFSDRSYSKYMQYYSTFLDWCQGIGKVNYFKKVPKRITIYTPEIITQKDFEKLLSVITPENGIQITPGQKKQTRNMYRSWLVHAFKISLETGRRRPEVVSMKWSDIYSENSIPIYIKVADSKVNNIMKLERGEMKYVYVPVTSTLHELIKDGYQKYLETKQDGYIIAPEITEKREEKMCDAMSRGFSNYYKLINPNEKEQLSFGCLRKTYLTQLEIHSKGQTAIVSGHGSGGKTVLSRHYIDPRAIASVNVAKNFSVFPEEIKRNKELSEFRKREKGDEKSLEI